MAIRAAVLAAALVLSAPSGAAATESFRDLVLSAPASPAVMSGVRDRALSASASAAAKPEFHDRVFAGSAARSAGLRGATPARAYRAPDGIEVEVRVSSAVANPDVVAQEVVNFLGTRLHGSELGRLRVFIGTPSEIQGACGGDPRVLACYAAGEARMYVPDVDPGAGDSAGFTRDYAITHEYGHHIAAFRSHAPFPALNYGAKRWSSYEFVCAGADAGRYFPGDQGEHYLDDPGEAFADAYAHLYYPAVRWQYNRSLLPDAGAFAALRRDVLDPWGAPVRRTVTGYLGGARRARDTTFQATLDGTVDLSLRGPRGSRFDVAIYDGRRLVGRTRAPGSRDRLRLTLCRDGTPVATARVRVIRRGGPGRFALTILYPG